MTSTLPIESRLQRKKSRLVNNPQCGISKKGDVLLELAAHDIREDLELAVRMRAKTRPGLDAVLIDDAEAAKLLVLRVVVAAVTLSARYSIHCQTIRAHLAKLNVWNVLSQP